MKGRSHAAGDRRRIDRTAVAAAVVQIALLAGCAFLDRSGTGDPPFRYTVSATIQSGDGRRSVVSSENLEAFSWPGEMPLFGGPRGFQEPVARWYTSYLNEVLEARKDEPAFQDLYGQEPWCVVNVHVAPTAVLIEGEEEEDRLYRENHELPSCACGEACEDNVPPMQGVLSIAPTAPGRPDVIDFGSVEVGVPHGGEVVLRNVGDGLLCLNAPQVDASSSEYPDDFAVMPISGCEATSRGLVLEAGRECRFHATFTPGGSGLRSARVPTLHGCGAFLTFEGVGIPGQLTASPAPACFTPDEGETCAVVPIRIDNASAASVSLRTISVAGADGWEAPGLEDASGASVDLAVAPLVLGPGGFATVIIRACAGANTNSMLRITHNGTDYGEPGSPTGDVDSGSPLAVALLSRTSGCMPTP